MKFHLLLYISLLCADFAFAQNDSLSLAQAIDNATMPSRQSTELHKNDDHGEQVVIKKFDQRKWKEIVGNENYSEELPKRKHSKTKTQRMRDSANSKEMDGRRFLEKEGDEEDFDDSESGISIPINPTILKIIFYSITFSIIGYILFLIVKNISLKPRTKVSKKELLNDTSPVTDIRELEIDILLRDALASGNYRLAIRIYFLGLLKKLDEDGFIVWKKNKTNRDYLSELFSKQYYFQELKNLTLAYEQVWYGDHTLSTEAYEEIISSFRSVDQKIKATQDQ